MCNTDEQQSKGLAPEGGVWTGCRPGRWGLHVSAGRQNKAAAGQVLQMSHAVTGDIYTTPLTRSVQNSKRKGRNQTAGVWGQERWRPRGMELFLHR